MPTPATFQTIMSLFKGLAPAVDANGFIANPAVLPRVVAKTADYTVLATESGTIFTTVGATAAVVFTLPAATAGNWVYLFFVGADQDLTVTAGTADTLITFNDVAADSVAFSTASEKVGGCILAFSDGTRPYAVAFGVSHRQTATIAT